MMIPKTELNISPASAVIANRYTIIFFRDHARMRILGLGDRDGCGMDMRDGWGDGGVESKSRFGGSWIGWDGL